MFYVLCNRTLRPAWMHRLMFGFGLHTVQYILPIYHGHKPLRQLQPYQVRFLCVNSVLRQCSSFLKVFHRSSETLTSLQQVQEHLNVFMRLAPARYHLDTETRVAVYNVHMSGFCARHKLLSHSFMCSIPYGLGFSSEIRKFFGTDYRQ